MPWVGCEIRIRGMCSSKSHKHCRKDGFGLVIAVPSSQSKTTLRQDMIYDKYLCRHSNERNIDVSVSLTSTGLGEK